METFYFGEESRRLFGALSRPAGMARASLVFCPAWGDEMICTYARLAQWAKELTDQRFAVLRYHPFGTGESDGKCGDFTPRGAAEDAVTAARWMREHVQAERVGFFGLRLGAAVAAMAAPAAQPDFLVLWSPIINFQQYCRDLLRWRLTKELVHQKVERVRLTVKDMIAQLEAGQTIDVVGYDISPEFYRQMTAGNGWPEQLPAPRILWMARPREESQAKEIIEAWRKRGAEVDLVVADDPIFWEDFSSGLPRGFAEASFRWIAELGHQPVEAR